PARSFLLPRWRVGLIHRRPFVMRIRWRGLELPSRVVSDRATLTDTYGRFTIEPFERGLGTTVGNSLRRVLLSSLEGSAVTRVKNGRGYRMPEENVPGEREIGVIPIDSSFSPVVRVKFEIEETRVGQRTNYDKLTMEIWTNGTITPQMALVEGAKILRKHLNPFIQYAEPGPEVAMEGEAGGPMPMGEAVDHDLQRKLDMSLAELELS